MKYLFLILISTIFFSCSDEPLNPFFNTEPNAYSGHWQIETSGDLPGAATIYVNSAGTIKNGMPLIYYDIAKSVTYIDGIVNKDGSIQAVFYSNYIFESETDTINIISSTGSFEGVFNPDNASGSYQIALLNGDSFSGSWSGFRLD